MDHVYEETYDMMVRSMDSFLSSEQSVFGCLPPELSFMIFNFLDMSDLFTLLT